MAKSSKMLVEQKAKNPVYCEILIKLNTRELSAYGFADEFQNKTQPTLFKQLEELKIEGFVKKRKDGKKQLYYISWDKIITEFFNFLKVLRPEKKMPQKFRKNKYLSLYFQHMFKWYHKNKVYPTLEDIFRNTVNSVMDGMITRGKTPERKDFCEFAEHLREYMYSDDIYEISLEDFAEHVDKLDKH